MGHHCSDLGKDQPLNIGPKLPLDLGPGPRSGAVFYLQCSALNLVRLLLDEKRSENHPAQTRHKKAMLYLAAFLAVLVLIGFLL